MASAARTTSVVYERRRPEKTTLYEIVRDNVETLYGAIDDGAVAVRMPKHTKKALEAYLDCGLLCRGFARLRRERCEESRLVAFSYKERGFCPSCLGRRFTYARSASPIRPEIPSRATRRRRLTLGSPRRLLPVEMSASYRTARAGAPRQEALAGPAKAPRRVAPPGALHASFLRSIWRSHVPSERGEAAEVGGAAAAASTAPVQRKCAPCEEEEGRIQKNAVVSSPGDRDEQEADQIADRVLGMPAPSNTEPRDSPVSPAPHGVIAGLGAGTALDPATRSFFEPRFNQDFSAVRVHEGTRAAESARSLGARAYTTGHHLVFGAGEYQPNTTPGRRLLSHELTHVVQQRSGAAASIARIQRQAKTPAEACGGDFKREFLGKINDEPPEKHRNVPRMYHATIPEKTAPGTTVAPLVTGTELEVGQAAGYGGLWRAVCHKTEQMPAQILWVLNEYITNLDEQRKEETKESGEEKKEEGNTPAPEPPAAPDPKPDPLAEYAAIPHTLMATLRRSYEDRMAGVKGAEKNLDNAFWGRTHATFRDCLDALGAADLNTLVQVHERMAAAGPAWSHILYIGNVWTGTSRGFKLIARDSASLLAEIKGNGVYCADTGIGGSMHPGEECFREAATSDAGLHWCIGSPPHDVHIDWHHPVKKKDPDGTCNYSASKSATHHMDLQDIRGKSPFERDETALLEEAKSALEAKRAEISGREDVWSEYEKEIQTIEASFGRRRGLAMEGASGESQWGQVLDRLVELTWELQAHPGTGTQWW